MLPQVACGFCIICVKIASDETPITFSLAMYGSTLEYMEATALNILNHRNSLEECIDRRVPVPHEAYL